MIKIAAIASWLFVSGLANAASVSVNIPITVTPALSGSPGVTLSVSPSAIAPGGSSTISWSSPNATTCKGFGGFSTGDAISGSVAVSPITTTTYGLSCSNASSVSSTVSTLTVSLVNVVNANGNCAGAHAGTSGDPFPFSCIVSAINGLPAGGGTVVVGDGYWANSTAPVILYRGNFNLVGASLNARIVLMGGNYFTMSGGQNIRVSNLTIDPTNYSDNYLNPFHFQNTQNASLTNCTVLSDPNSGLAAVLVEGGANNRVVGNTITPNATGGGGGDQLQFNPFGGSANSGFLVQGNTFDSVGVYVIGMNQFLFTGNRLHNQTMGQQVFLYDAPEANSSMTNAYNIIDNNTLDGDTLNNAVIAGLTQDPGLPIANMDNLIISNNTVTGTKAWISLQAPDEHCFTTTDCDPLPTTSNARILNNTVTSRWTFSTVSIRGGSGAVTNPLVQGNTIQPAGQILQDAHTFNATIIGNTLN